MSSQDHGGSPSCPREGTSPLSLVIHDRREPPFRAQARAQRAVSRDGIL